MADLIERIRADDSVSSSRRRDILSSVRRFCALLDLEPARAPAAFPFFRDAIRRFHPARGNISPKRWSNIRSDVALVLDRYGARRRSALARDLLPEWRAPRARIDNPVLVRRLSRLFHWCSSRGLIPEAVNDDVVSAFYSDLREHSFARKPHKLHRDACRAWNLAAGHVPDWPATRLALPQHRDLISLPWSAFPASLVDEIETWARVMSGARVLDSRAPDRPLRPETIRLKREQIRRGASALVRSGFPVERITSLACLVEAGHLRSALTLYHDRLGGKAPSLYEMAYTMVTLAKNWVGVEGDQLAELKKMRKALKCRQRGFTPKTYDRLRQFDDLEAQARLLALPDQLVRMARKRSAKDRKAALLVQTALAIEILLAAPMRLANLIELHLDRHFRFTRPDRRGTCHLVIPREAVKNNVPLELVVPARVLTIFDLYWCDYRSQLAPDTEGWVFPGERGGHKHKVSVSQQIVGTIARHTGITMHVHLFRHLAAKLYLDAHPGDYVTVQRLLGHRSLETTIAFYAAFETRSAFRAFDQLIERRRDDLKR